MTYRMAICMGIIFPTLCIAAESRNTALNLQPQPTMGTRENHPASAQPGDQEYENLVKELTKYKKVDNKLTAQSGVLQHGRVENILDELTTQSGVGSKQQEIIENLLKTPTTQSSVQQDENPLGTLFRLIGSNDQTSTKATHEEDILADVQLIYEYEKKKLVYFLVIVVVIGALLWNKFIRLRCPDCGKARPVLVRIEDVDTWLAPKVVNERRSKERLTSFTKVKRVYMCMSCGERWVVLSNNKN